MEFLCEECHNPLHNLLTRDSLDPFHGKDLTGRMERLVSLFPCLSDYFFWEDRPDSFDGAEFHSWALKHF